jgi:uncharacterized protein (TIGR02246 family)
MSNTYWTRWLLSLVIFACATGKATAREGGQDEAALEQDKVAIEKAILSYVSAFNARDAKKLASHWSPEGVYISRRHAADSQASQVSGHDALTEEFTTLFAESADIRLEVATESIEFISPNVALERGSATVWHPDGPPGATDYRVVYVKRDGQWLIDRVTEEERPVIHTHYDKLQALAWLIGDWEDQAGEVTIRTECHWTRNKNFLTRSFTVSAGDRVDLSGMQVIGWDPAEKVIRSWLFDSDGGFATGVWKQQSQRWTVQTTATLDDGRKGSSMTIIRPIDENSFGWQKINRLVDGEILPNIDEVVIVRGDSQQ